MEFPAASAAKRHTQVRRLGLRPFAEVWELQRRLQAALIDGGGQETLLVCQHYPVITAGRSAKMENLLASPEKLKKNGIEVLHIERGGDFTFHAPGQIVAYPILNLSLRRRDVHWYMRSLEEVIIRTLERFQIKAQRITGRSGVWTQVLENDRALDAVKGAESAAREKAYKKIASLGVRISRWCTMHGFALNVQDCEYGFSYINPCGFTDTAAASMKGEAHREFDIDEVESVVVEKFFEVFG